MPCVEPTAALAQVPVGSEFQVNTFTTSAQRFAAVAVNGAGDFVVVWESFGQANFFDVFGQRYDSTGAAVGGEFQVNTSTLGSSDPAVAIDGAGNFVVVWTGDDGGGSGVLGQRYDSTGAAVGGEFQVNTYTTGAQYSAAVAADPTGNFVVVWESANLSGGQDGSSGGIFGQRYASTGSALGGEFQVNTYTTDYQTYPAVAVAGSGDFVVVWGSEGQDGSLTGVFGQRYASTGSALGGEFQVNTYTFMSQNRPAVAADGVGNFVVAWESAQDLSQGGIFGQRYASTGASLGGEFQINTYEDYSQSRPAVAVDGAGDFVVAWGSNTQDGDVAGVFGQRYASTGSALGAEFQVNTYSTGGQGAPTVGADSAGNFVVAWESDGQDGSGAGVFGQRFAPTPIVPATGPLGWFALVGLLTLAMAWALRRRARLCGGRVLRVNEQV